VGAVVIDLDTIPLRGDKSILEQIEDIALDDDDALDWLEANVYARPQVIGLFCQALDPASLKGWS